MDKIVRYQALLVGKPEDVTEGIRHWAALLISLPCFDSLTFHGEGGLADPLAWHFPPQCQVWKAPEISFELPGASTEESYTCSTIREIEVALQRSVGSEKTLLGWGISVCPQEQLAVADVTLSKGLMPTGQPRTAHRRLNQGADQKEHLDEGFLKAVCQTLVPEESFEALMAPLRSRRLQEVFDTSFRIAGPARSAKPRL